MPLFYRGIDPALVRGVLRLPPDYQNSQAPGNVPWADTSHIESSGSGEASVTLSGAAPDSEVFYAAALMGRAAIPAAATITGVVFNMLAAQTGAPICKLLQIVDHAGAQIGTDRKADIGTLAGTGLQLYVVGDLKNTLTAEWGAAVAALTVANWQHANTGIVWQFTDGIPGDATIEIDFAWLDLYFQE